MSIFLNACIEAVNTNLVKTYVIMAEITAWINLYITISLNLTLALDTKEYICIRTMSELKDSIKDIITSLEVKDIFKLTILFIPLEISNIPIINPLIKLGIKILLVIRVGTSEKIIVKDKIKPNVFKVLKVLIYNSSKAVYFLQKLFEFVFICCIIPLEWVFLIKMPKNYSR